MMKTILLLCAAALSAFAQNPRAITVTSPAKVESTRAALVQYIWGTSWETVTAKQPRLVDHDYKPQTDDALPASIANLESIDRLDVGGLAASTAFVLYPSRPNLHKVVIVHHGHGCDLLDRGDASRASGVCDSQISRRRVYGGRDAHAALSESGALWRQPERTTSYSTFTPKRARRSSIFMEPIARTVNYLVAHHPELQEIDMIGLSGGGWTTTVYAAIDPRIVKSIPVAGTLPLYLRGDHYNHDLEQYVAGALPSGRLPRFVCSRRGGQRTFAIANSEPL